MQRCCMDNGVDVMVGTKVLRINLDEEKHCVKSVTTDKGDVACSFVVNAAAIYADEIAKTVGLCDYRNYPRTGEFYVLDKNLPYAPSHIIAPLPTPVTRGKLVTPTINGNMATSSTHRYLSATKPAARGSEPNSTACSTTMRSLM